MTIVDHRDAPMHTGMDPVPCTKEDCLAPLKDRWGIRPLTHHHPTPIPAHKLSLEDYEEVGAGQVDAYTPDRHLLFDGDGDLVTGWSEGGGGYWVHYLPRDQYGRTDELREIDLYGQGTICPSPFELMHKTADVYYQDYSYGLDVYHYMRCVLVTHWDEPYSSLMPSAEEIAAARASILRDISN